MFRNSFYSQKKENLCIVSGLTSRPSSSSLDRREKQFAVLTSERRSHVVLLPTQTGVFRNIISDTSYAVKAEVTSLKDLGEHRIAFNF